MSYCSGVCPRIRSKSNYACFFRNSNYQYLVGIGILLYRDLGGKNTTHVKIMAHYLFLVWTLCRYIGNSFDVANSLGKRWEYRPLACRYRAFGYYSHGDSCPMGHLDVLERQRESEEKFQQIQRVRLGFLVDPVYRRNILGSLSGLNCN